MVHGVGAGNVRIGWRAIAADGGLGGGVVTEPGNEAERGDWDLGAILHFHDVCYVY